MSGAPTHLTGVFENLLSVTLGIAAKDDSRAGGDPTLRGLPPSVVRAVGEELTTAEDGDPTDPVASEAAQALRDMDEFDRRLANGAAADEGGSSTAKKRHALSTGADSVVAKLPVRRKAPIGIKGLAWSPEAAGLASDIEASRRRAGGASLHSFTGRTFLYGRFETLKLVNMRITAIDDGTSRFRGLKHLNVSGNRLSALRRLPEGLRTVQAYGNRITAVQAAPPCPSCSHAGLGYNQIADCGPVAAALPSLASLDLSWNAVADLGAALDALSALRPTLRHLELSGNPCALVPGYRRRVEETLGPAAGGALETLDGLPVGGTPRPGEAAESGTAAPGGFAELRVELVRVGGVPMPADVDGWAEAVAEEEAAKAGGKKGAAKKGKKGAASAEPSPRPSTDTWLVDVSAEPVEVVGSGRPESSSGPCEDSGPLGEALSGREGVWGRVVVSARPDTALRDALAVKGLSLGIGGRLAAQPAEEGEEADGDGAATAGTEAAAAADSTSGDGSPSGAATDGTVGPEAAPEPIGVAIVPCKDVLEPAPASAAGCGPDVRAPLRLLGLPQATKDAALLASRAAVAQEVAAAAAEAAGGKKGKKGEAPPPLTEEQEADAARRAAELCDELVADASAFVVVRVSLRR